MHRFCDSIEWQTDECSEGEASSTLVQVTSQMSDRHMSDGEMSDRQMSDRQTNALTEKHPVQVGK